MLQKLNQKTNAHSTQMPSATVMSNKGKNLYFLYFDPAHPQGHVMSLRCEKPLDELTVKVWLLHVYLNLKYHDALYL